MADVILHEMAHMWFGNLVTMRWWNDLWLNESFATYMANLALAEATEFKEAWLSFQDTKQWAYWEDDLVTKHPITTAVPDTNQAFANFDGITYGKGASVLKQLSFYLGHDVFKQGIQRYFSQYSWKNTELKDFIGSLEQSARRDLKQFTNEWLETQGTNTIKPVYSCENGKIDTFYIRQHAQPGELQSRSHRAILALVKKNDEKTLSLMETIAYTYSGPQTSIEEAKGKPCPDFVYPNYEDHDFVKVELDARSLDTASQSLRFLDDSLLRGLVWSTLWDMVRQSKLTIQSYGDLAKNHIFVEENLQITRAVLGNIYGRLGHHSPSLAYYLPVEGPQNQKDKTSILTEWEELMWKQVEQSTPGSDRQKVWFDAYYEISQSSKALNRLVDLIKNRKTVPGLSLDQNRRWNIITHLSGFDVPDLQRLIEQERKADPSSDGQKSILAAQAARPEIQKKDQWYSTVANPANGKTLAERRSIMRHLFPENQTKIRARYVERFFRDVMKLSKESNESLLDSFIDNLAPTLCTADSPRRLQKFIDEQGKNLPSYAIKSLRIAQQEDQRCTTIRAYAKSYDRKGIKG
jgi:aminopeptidase N